MSTLRSDLEQHPIFALFLAVVLEQLLELPERRLTDIVGIQQHGGNWEAANLYYMYGG